MEHKRLTESLWTVPVLFLLLAIGLGALGWRYQVHEALRVKRDAQDSLSAIAQLRAEQIARWREDRLLDAEAIRLNPWVTRGVANLLRGPRSPGIERGLLAWLEALRTRFDFASVALFDPDGNVPYRAGPGEIRANRVVVEGLAQVLRTGRPTLSDLHRHLRTGAIHLDLLTPLALQEPGGARMIGALSFRIEPRRFLYPLLAGSPLSSRTAETMLIEREGDGVVYLSDLRHRKDAPLSVHVALSEVRRPEVQAALGREGAIEGLDYRGVAVLAATKRVPDSPWCVVTQIDQDEVYAPIQQGAWSLAVQIGALILAAGFAGMYIFERQRAGFVRREEEVLRVSEARFRQMIETTQEGVVLVDATARIAYANRRLAEMFRCDEGELLGTSIFDFVDKTSKATAVESFERRKTGAKETFDVRLVRKDGTPCWGMVSATPVIDAQGRFEGSFSVISDITERKRAEEALAQSEQRYRILADAAFEGIALSEGGILLDVNEQLAGLLGYSRGELVGKPVLECVAPEHREMVSEAIRAGRTATYEHLLLRADGTKVPVETRARGVQIGDRRVRLAALRDLSERKRAKEDLRLSHERLEATFASLSSAVFLLDASTTRIAECNRAAIDIFGYAREEMLGCTTDFLHVSEQSLGEFREHLRAGMERYGRLDGFEFRMRRKDGTVFETEHSVSPLRGANGAQVGWVSIVRDISEKVRLKAELEQAGAQLLQAQKMEAIGRLAGGIAHDFNNLLMVILSYSELALRAIGEHSRAAELLNGVRAAVDQAKALTQQILAFSRRQVLALTILDPNAEIVVASKMLRRVIGEDIEIEARLEPKPGHVRADRAQLQQVLLNLAINARDAMPQGGTLTFETAEVFLEGEVARSLHGARPGPYVVIRVSDTGVGMDAVTVSRLFEPFFTTKELGRGTGLGLATVYGIVKQHEGYIEAESAPGAGARFTIYLPRVGDGAEASDTIAAEAAGGGETVLLVEDHALVREATRRQLTESGYKVLCAANALAALELARGHEGRIDLLLTDIGMPGMTGPELFSRLAAERPGIKVLLMSGYAGARSTGTDNRLGAELAFIQKPVGIADLRRRIQEILRAATQSG